MSITNDYQNIADFCAGFAHRSEPIPARTAATLASNLLDLADRAKRMERFAIVLDGEPVVYAACERDGSE